MGICEQMCMCVRMASEYFLGEASVEESRSQVEIGERGDGMFYIKDPFSLLLSVS